MSDEEIMKQFQEAMREEELKKEAPENVAPYKATRNLNTQIGNPSADLNNTMDVNIQNNNISFSQQTSPDNNDVKPFSVNPMSSNIENNITNNSLNDVNNDNNLNNIIQEPVINTPTPVVPPVEVNNINNTNIENNINDNNLNNIIQEPVINTPIPVEPPVELNNKEYSVNNNLNVAISNPEFNMGSTMDINIKNDTMDINMDGSNEEYIPEEENNYYPGNTSNRVFISDSARRKKKKTIKINSETKTMLIIVIFLFVFIIFLPRIYDFFRLIRSYFIR